MMMRDVMREKNCNYLKGVLACAACICFLPLAAMAQIPYQQYQGMLNSQRIREAQESLRLNKQQIHGYRKPETPYSSRHSTYSSGGGGWDIDFARFSLYGTHLSFIDSKHESLDTKGGGMLLQINQFAWGFDIMGGEITKNGVRLDDGIVFFTDVYLVLPPLFALTEIDSDGLSIGVGPGYYLCSFNDKRPYSMRKDDDIDDFLHGLGISAFVSYKFVFGEVGVRARKLFGSDYGAICQFTYGLAF